MEDETILLRDKLIGCFYSDSLGVKIKKFRKRDNIYTYGGLGNLFFIERGHVKISTLTEDGCVCNIGFYSEGEFFGESGLSGEVVSETATALTDCIVRKINIIDCLKGGQNGDLNYYLIIHMAKKIIKHQEIISSFVVFNSEKRLAYTLMKMSSETDKEDMNLFLIKNKISHQDLSHLIGTTRSRVGYFLNIFYKMGLIKNSKDCFLVVDKKRIVDYLVE